MARTAWATGQADSLAGELENAVNRLQQAVAAGQTGIIAARSQELRVMMMSLARNRPGTATPS